MVDPGCFEIAEQRRIVRMIGDRYRDVRTAIHENDGVADGQQIGIGAADINLVQAQKLPLRIRRIFRGSAAGQAAYSQDEGQENEENSAVHQAETSRFEMVLFR